MPEIPLLFRGGGHNVGLLALPVNARFVRAAGQLRTTLLPCSLTPGLRWWDDTRTRRIELRGNIHFSYPVECHFAALGEPVDKNGATYRKTSWVAAAILQHDYPILPAGSLDKRAYQLASCVAAVQNDEGALKIMTGRAAPRRKQIQAEYKLLARQHHPGKRFNGFLPFFEGRFELVSTCFRQHYTQKAVSWQLSIETGSRNLLWEVRTQSSSFAPRRFALPPLQLVKFFFHRWSCLLFETQEKPPAGRTALARSQVSNDLDGQTVTAPRIVRKPRPRGDVANLLVEGTGGVPTPAAQCAAPLAERYLHCQHSCRSCFRPQPEAAHECISVVAWTAALRQLLELLHVAPAKNNVVGLEGCG